MRLSWDQLKLMKPDFRSEILRQPGCQGMTLGLAAGILAADRRAKVALGPELDRIIQLVELVVVEMKLDQPRVKSICEAFATDVILGSGRLSLSTAGVLFSLIASFVKANTTVRLQTSDSSDRPEFYSLVLAERPSTISESKANREAAEAWQKLCRYSLACMSEVVEAHMKLQEEIRSAGAHQQSRTSSILRRRRQSAKTQLQASNGIV